MKENYFTARRKKTKRKNNKKYITKEYVMCWFDLKEQN